MSTPPEPLPPDKLPKLLHAQVVPCIEHWYAIYREPETKMITYIPIVAWYVDGMGNPAHPILAPVPPAPATYRFERFCRGSDVANVIPRQDGKAEAITWDVLLSRTVAEAIAQHHKEAGKPVDAAVAAMTPSVPKA